MSETKQIRYADLLDEALARIPALAPEWTDHNPGDPGIALLELAAWLTETVLYRSTRIDDRSRRALLGLIEGRDPDPTLSGEALDGAIRRAIKALRRPYRAVSPPDFVDRIRADWPSTDAAKALGLDSRVAEVLVLPRCDLEAADRFARRDAHISVVAVPDHLCWSYAGTLSTARPRLFLQQPQPATLKTSFPKGGRVVVSSAGSGALIYEGDFVDGEAGTLDVTAAHLGETGELVVELDQANAIAGMTLDSAGSVNRRRLTGGDGTLLGCRFVPIRRPCDVEVTVTTTAEIPLKLIARHWSNGLVAEAEGVGVVSMSASGPKGDGAVNESRRDWQLQLSAPEAEPGTEIEVHWHVQRVEMPWRWNEARGDTLLDGIWTFLDSRRVIGTRHHVVGPRWVPFAIAAEIYLTDDTDPDLVRPRLLDALVDHFAPPGHVGTSRGIGEDLHYTEVIAAIEAVPGVDYVDELSLTPVGRLLTDDGERYGLRLERDEIAVLQVPACALTLFERS